MIRSVNAFMPAAWRALRRVPPGLALALLAGLALRLWLWGGIPRTGWISDEGEYYSAATWLAQGRGFAWYLHYLWTRAPLYPLFVAAHLRLFGDLLTPIYASQLLLSLLNVALVYGLARQLVRPGRSTDYADDTDYERRVYSRIPMIAALLMALYFPFAIYPQALLSETLFMTLLLAGFLALAGGGTRHATRDTRHATRTSKLNLCHLRNLWISSSSRVALAGGLLGLATLTRSLTLLFLPIVAIWLFAQEPRTKNQEPSKHSTSRFAVRGSRLSIPLVFLLAAALVIAPWTLYNSRVYGGLVLIDTSGAFNLMLGGRTAYDGNNRLDAPTRNVVRALVDQNLTREQRAALLVPIVAPDGTVLSDGPCLSRRGDAAFAQAIGRPDATSLPQAAAQRLMTAEGLCLIAARPGAFAAKSLAELADLFQINYSGDERFTDHFTTGRLPRWYALGLFLLDDTLYVLALPLAVIGWGLARKQKLTMQNAELSDASLTAQRSQCSILIGLWLLYNLAVAPLLFAINRFRLPLMPFVLIFAAYALARFAVRLTQRQGEPSAKNREPHYRHAEAGTGRRRRLPRMGQLAGWLWGGLALALFLLAATPYAYFLPLNERGASPWASYFGPFPGSLDDTLRALAARPAYLRSEQLRAALRAGAVPAAGALLAAGALTPDTQRLAPALLAGLEGRYAEGLARFDPAAIAATRDVQAAVVYADLLRSSGDMAGARKLFSEQFVDNANPVEFAWDWLRPAPTTSIDIAGNLDLGYIHGCYLGEGDPQAGGNFRWCSDGAQIRFPQAGTGAAQRLVLRADGRGWAGYGAPPQVQVLVGGQEAGSFTLTAGDPAEYAVRLPPTPAGADVLITLRSATFVPDAARYLSQQGAQVGQVQRLGVRLDWARLEAMP